MPCNPPCEIDRLIAHQKERPRMKKADLIAELLVADDIYVNQHEEIGMLDAAWRGLDAHLKAHDCDHNIEEKYAL